MRLGKALAAGVAETSQDDAAPAVEPDAESARPDVSAASGADAPPRSDADRQAATPPAR